MHVILVAPHFPANQRNFARALRAVGARVTGIGDAPVEYLDSQLKSWLDDYVYLPRMLDEEELEKAVRGIQRKSWVDRLEATIETHMLPVARVRERTGIPGLTPQQVLVCRDKTLMKDVLRKAGIPCAKSARVETVGEGLAFARSVGYPIIIKPIAGAGAAGTHKVTNDRQLLEACREHHLDKGGAAAFEEFIEGHEGFYDTLLMGDEVVFDGVSHYFPNVLEAMRTREGAPRIVTTNLIDSVGAYQEVRDWGKKVVQALGLTNTPTHQEWFFGPKGYRFSEIGARPPGVCFWDVHNLANDMDLYVAWAEVVAVGRCSQKPSRRYAAALQAIRPTADGTIRAYEGMDRIQAKYGAFISKAHLPPVGSPARPVEGGFMANAWLMLRHPNFDVLKLILEDIEATVKIHAG
jgi:carbamoylphosphate synthase large subunit